MSVQRPNEIPPATDELLAAAQRKIGKGRLNLRRLKPAGIDDAETERHVQEITHSYGAHAQIPPATKVLGAAVTEATAAAATAARRTRYASFRVDLPEYLDQELTMTSAL